MVFDPNAKAPDLLNKNLIRSLQRDAEILELPFDVDDPKTNNLIVTTSSATKASAIKVDQNRRLDDGRHRRGGLLLFDEALNPSQHALQGFRLPFSHETPMPLVSIIEEPPREIDFTEFHRLKDAQEPSPAPEPVEVSAFSIAQERVKSGTLAPVPDAQDTPYVDPGLAARHYQPPGRAGGAA
jgi:hypothetical protein